MPPLRLNHDPVVGRRKKNPNEIANCKRPKNPGELPLLKILTINDPGRHRIKLAGETFAIYKFTTTIYCGDNPTDTTIQDYVYKITYTKLRQNYQYKVNTKSYKSHWFHRNNHIRRKAKTNDKTS